jgi:hypothetical protein
MNEAKGSIEVRKGQGEWPLAREEFERRYRERFYDPIFAADAGTIGRLMEIAWKAYVDYHKSPRKQCASTVAIRIQHGDAAGADTLRRSLVDWLTDMELLQARTR